MERRKVKAEPQNDRGIDEVLVYPMKMIVTITVTRIIQIQTKRTISIQFKDAIVIGELETIWIKPFWD